MAKCRKCGEEIAPPVEDGVTDDTAALQALLDLVCIKCRRDS